jgi:hypothetical protein
MSTAFQSAPRSRRPAANGRSPLYPVPASPRPVQSPRRSRPPLRTVTPSAVGAAAVRRLPSQRSLPLWVQLLVQAQRGSLVIAFILVTATLIVYGSTVYTQQLWSKEYRKLKTLQRNEREMIATNEGLKNQLALQADQPGSGLVPPTPDSTIFLQPAPQRPTLMTSPNVPKAEVEPNTPLGY